MPWQEVIRSSLCSGVKECGKKLAHNFLFPKSTFRIRITSVFETFKDSAIILDVIRRSFLTNQQQQQCLPQFELILDAHLSLSSTSSLPSRNWEYHKPHKPFAPILVFLFQIDWLWNRVLWQPSVHFHHPWRIKKTDFTGQVITRTLSKIKKGNSVCERMLFYST